MTFVMTVSRSTANLAVSIHAAGCPCTNRAARSWPIEATTIDEARAEVEASEDAVARGIPVKVAPCAKAVSDPRTLLRDAMLALHLVLSELELEYENTVAAAELCPSRRQRRGLESLAAVYSQRLNSLRQFFDWDVYNDRQPANAVAA